MVPSRGTTIASWYSRIAAFNVATLFARKREPGPPRTVYVNDRLPDDHFDHRGRPKKDHIYATNQVITSKYTILTFLPRNLLEQFRRVANLFFLGIALLQISPTFSTLSPGVVILPLIVVLGITALKDGYEDFKRHQSDKRVNYSTVKVLSGGDWVNPNLMHSKERNSSAIILRRFQHLLDNRHNSASTEPASEVEVDYNRHSVDRTDYHKQGPHWRRTHWEDVRVGDFVKVMDNEAIPADILICATSEDENVAFVETKNLDGETNLKSRHGVAALSHLNNALACADPADSFRVQCDRPDNDMYRLNANVTFREATYPVDLSMALLRGTVLKNTDWIIGVVLFTGPDTKIVLNSGGTPSKRSKVERQMNPQVLLNLLLLAIMVTVCAIADSVLEKRFYPMDAPWLFWDNRKGDNPSINGGVTWAFAILTFQDIVPISLYISIEFVRTCQAAFIYFDYDIYYDKTDQATLARSWNLSDDLGQIEYIFSDKTGTLTQNSMVFRQCSVGGVAYRGDAPSSDAGHNEDGEKSIKPVSITDPASGNLEVNVVLSSQSSASIAETPASSHNLIDEVKITPKSAARFRDSALLHDLGLASSSTSDSAHSELLNRFFTVLALCHSVLTAVDPATGEIQYKAQSPDEAALVQAAADVGFVFRGRERDVLHVTTPSSAPDAEKYQLLNILEFSSARKRMSVIVRQLREGNDGQLLLLTKGADNVIIERLEDPAAQLVEDTEAHLSEFARSGLRTLTLAYKIIPDDQYETWSARYHDATVSMDDREAKIEAVCDEIERDLRLLGATAIEDRLQDGVPETIADLKRAGIKIWVATGDKLETAVAIGKSTRLISPESNLIVIRGGVKSAPVNVQLSRAIEEFFLDSEHSVLKQHSMPTPDDAQQEIPLQRMLSGVSSLVGRDNGERPGGYVLVIDGAALAEAFDNEGSKSLLLRLGTLCEGVICCRVSPLQKALIVRLVKDGLRAMTLAIGDGANDVSMIQAADVGIGIAGEEGLQAVNSSDYAIAQFRFLKKLLLVHGHWSYARNGTMILNFFYKNIVSVGVLWWFQIYEGWSGYYVFDYIYILFWNSLWTIAPVIGVGVFDRFLDSHILMAIPELYCYGREGTWFGIKPFLVYILDGIVQSAIIYFLIHYTYTSPTSRKDGYDTYIYEFSTTMAISTVMIADIYTGFNATAWTAWLFFAVFIGIVVVWVFTIIYSLVSPGYAVTALYGNDYFLFTSAYFWLCLPLTFCLALLPRYLAKAWRSAFAPDDLSIIRWIAKNEPHRDLARDVYVTPLHAFQRPVSPASRRSGLGDLPQGTAANDSVTTINQIRPSMDVRVASRTDMSTGIVSVDRGFDFATEEHGVAMQRMQSNLSENRIRSRGAGSRAPKKGKESSFSQQILSLRRGLLRRKEPSTGKAG